MAPPIRKSKVPVPETIVKNDPKHPLKLTLASMPYKASDKKPVHTYYSPEIPGDEQDDDKKK